jgi:hypothetical protein
MINPVPCVLCSHPECSLAFSDKARHYFCCPDCGLVFVPPSEHVSIDDEKMRYGRHKNTYDNQDYKSYLIAFSKELQRIPIHQPEILDFGCGEHRVMERILREQGISCSSYDPLYAIGLDTLQKSYDIIIANEVLEHVRNLHEDLALILKLMKPHGYALFQTQLLTPDINFDKWWYKEDETHINFLTAQTLQKIAQLFHLEIIYMDNVDTVIFKR